MTTDIQELLERAQAMQDVQDLRSELGSTAGGLLNRGLKEMMKDASDPTVLVPLYHTATGEMRMVPMWTLDGKNSLLLRRNPDGKPTFSTRQPEVVYRPGEVPCMLNPAHADYNKYRNEVGIIRGEPCPAGNLASLYDMRMHMQHRHRQEWATIQDYENEERDAEDRMNQRLMARAAAAALGESPARRRRKGEPPEGDE